MRQEDKSLRKKIFEIIEAADEKSKLRRWSEYYDIFMTVVIFLSIVPLAFAEEHFVLTVVEWVATAIFIIDYILRWCTADYKLKDSRWMFRKIETGKKAFIVYPFTFWAIIDLLSILPSFYLVSQSFRVIRAARFLRLLRLLKAFRYDNEYLKGFKFFKKGMEAAKEDMIASLEVLVFLTLILAFLLYVVEHAAQPDVYKYPWDSLVWSFMSYLGNPGKFSPGDPVTVVGRMLWIIIALIKIALFAVPAGLIANGFRAAMAKDKKERTDKENADKIRNTFYTHGDILNNVIYWPQSFYELNILKSRFALTEADIFSAINSTDDMRIRPYEGDFAVELMNRNTSYGFFSGEEYWDFKPTESNVTILCHNGKMNRCLGYYAYQLARIGRFNVVTNEVLASNQDNPDDRCVILGIREEQYLDEVNYPKLHAFISDVKKVVKDDNSWAIVLRRCADPKKDEDAHKVIGLRINVAEEKEDNTLDDCTTVKDTAKLKAFYEDLQNTMKKEEDVETFIEYKSQRKRWFSNYVHNYIGDNPNSIEILLTGGYITTGKGAKHSRKSIKFLEEVIHRHFETVNTDWNTEKWDEETTHKYAPGNYDVHIGAEYAWARITEVLDEKNGCACVEAEELNGRLQQGDTVAIVEDGFEIRSKIESIEIKDAEHQTIRLSGIRAESLHPRMCITNNLNTKKKKIINN